MKSIYKRFFALCLSMLMIFSMSAVAFAAEAEEKSDVALGEVLSEATMIASATSANADGYGNVTGNLSGSTANNLQVNFRVPDGGAYLYFIYSSEDYQRVTVRKDGVPCWERYLVPTDLETRTYQITFDYSPQDSYWSPGTYTLNVDFTYGHYFYALCVFASPYLLDV